MAVKKYKGKKPRTAGWLEIGAVEGDGCRWLVFVRPDAEWTTVKVAVDGYAPAKANYWFGWNGSRFSRVGDIVTLAQQRPTVLEAVERMLRDFGHVEGRDLL
jgi:hypothetical protein